MSFGDMTIQSAPWRGSPVVLKTAAQWAGGCHSLVWQGKEFVDTFDHGRGIQTALDYDELAEACNPTEDGSLADGNHPTTSSKLLTCQMQGPATFTAARMAYWHPFRGQKLSSTVLNKRITPNWHGHPNAFGWAVTLQVKEAHTSMVCEMLTGYLPDGFNKFQWLNLQDGSLLPIDLAGEAANPNPMIISTPDGQFAEGCLNYFVSPYHYYYAIGQASPNPSVRCAKWSVIYQFPHSIPAGEYSTQQVLVIGTLADVRDTIMAIWGGH